MINLKLSIRAIVEILTENAEDIGDIAGISETPEGAGEGISYAEAKINQDRYPDAVILAFDTYGGEPFVKECCEIFHRCRNRNGQCH